MNSKRKDLIHLVTVYPPEDIFIEGVLQTVGIQVFRKRESIAPIGGITLGPLGEVKLYVLREQEIEARDVLADARNDPAT